MTTPTPSWAVEQVWGSDRFYHEGDVAQDQYAFIVDSGVALLEDLNVHTEWSRSFVDSDPDPHGPGSYHGTAVASVIGSKANGVGLTGVAPGAQIVALKALADNTRGFNVDVQEALAYARDLIVENDLFDRAVINVSLGSGFPNRHPVVKEIADLGIKVVVAAGNQSRDADGFSPASYGDHENVYVVSANTIDGYYSGFTNFDGVDLDNKDDVDFSAPGTAVPVYDTDGNVSARNGTSYSAPLVAGVLLMSEEVRPGRTFTRTPDQIEKGMIPDPLGMFDPYTYKHGPRTGRPAPEAPADSIAPRVGEVVYVDVPGPEVIVEVPVPGPVRYIEVPGPEVIVEVPGPERIVEVPGPEVIVEVPVPGPVPDVILRGSATERNRFVGTDLDELLVGGSQRDKLSGSAGDDVLLGMGGGDRLKGGAGDDILISGGGNAKLVGGTGSDTFVLGVGTVRIKDFDPLEDLLGFDGELSSMIKGSRTLVKSGDDLLAVLKGSLTDLPTT